MHEGLSADDLPAEGVTHRLVAQAHAEQRHLARERLDHFDRNTGVLGIARPRRDHDPFGRKFLDPLQRDLVVAEDLHLHPQLAEILHQVVGEGIVVVDH